MNSPQFTKRTHRAREHMEVLGRRIPDIWSLVDQVRAANADDIGGPDWPSHCYLPLEHAGMIAAHLMQMDGVQPTPTSAARHGSIIATLAAWRMTQGIYRYDPALYPALVDTPLDGDLPAAILQHLPEWCVYIETPDMIVPTTRGDIPLRGTFAWLDRARGTSHDLLTLLLDAEGADLTVSHVPLIGTMQEAMESITRDWRDAHARGNAPSLPPASFETMARKTLTPIVSLLLYLCTDAADITGRKGAPGNPEPVRTRRYGMRLFPADGLRTWDVGVRIGAALRAAYQRVQLNQTPPTGPGLPNFGPHVRKPHWHTFVLGPRDQPEKQRRSVRWMPPIPVLLEDYDQLSSVIRIVK